MSNTTDTFYITNGTTQDGFGSRLQRCVCVMAYVYYLKHELNYPVEYIHTPFSYEGFENFEVGVADRSQYYPYTAYPYDDRSAEGYRNRAVLWDKKLAYKGKCINDFAIEGGTIIKYGFEDLTEDLRTGTTNRNLYVITQLNKQYDDKALDIEVVAKHRDRILENFGLKKNKSKKKQIAVHVRRKDAEQVDRYIADEYYLQMLKSLNRLVDSHDITVYTQRDGFDAASYKDYKVVYDDKENDYDSMEKLIFADHLITGHSSFSYVASLLNSNVVVYHNKGHIALKEWFNVDNYTKMIKQL